MLQQFLHGACCGTGVLKCDLRKSGLATSDKCRNGCLEKETLKHIILDCPHFDKNRLKLSIECGRLNLDVTVKNAICHPCLHLVTEKFFVVLNEKNN